MVEKSQSLRRGRDFTHELVVLKKSKSSSSFNSLDDDRKYTSLKTIRSPTASNYEHPVSTRNRECSARDEDKVEVATFSVGKRQSPPIEERDDVELEKLEWLSPPTQEKGDVKFKKLSPKIARCTCHAYVTVITTVVLAILLIGALVLAVLGISMARADADMLQLMTQQMVEKVRAELNESVTLLEGNLSQLVADFQGQSDESTAKLQDLNTTLRHEFTSKINTLNTTDQAILGNIMELNQIHGERLNQVESDLDQSIRSLNSAITSSKIRIESLQVQVRDNKMKMDNINNTVNNNNHTTNTRLTSIETTVTYLDGEVQKLKMMTCNCSCNCP